MKIIIEGEPKEIAAYELALRDGKETVINPVVRTCEAKKPNIDEFCTKCSAYATKIFR